MIKTQNKIDSFKKEVPLDTDVFFDKLRGIDLVKTPFSIFDVDLDFDLLLGKLHKSDVFNVLSFRGGDIFHVCDDPNARKIDYGKSSGFFCLHTDGQEFVDIPVVAILYCVKEGRADIPTDFIDSVDLVELIKKKDLLREIEKYDFVFTDRNGNETRRSIIEKHPLTDLLVMNISLGSDQCSFVPKKEDVGTVSEGEQLYKDISDLASIEIAHTPHYYKNGQVVVFDNARFIHGRGLKDLKDVDMSDKDRHLVRLWLTYKK
ncbi:hypothetical protein COB18_02515 [Candidatus Kaiserbacteria bacterium]|nr:MAG: hypothetical protein COB18_02515 [Candidatus Kaiserbacteria bacterium]